MTKKLLLRCKVNISKDWKSQVNNACLELKRFAEQNPQNENFDIQDQFVINTAIFKSNFQLILQMIGELAYFRVNLTQLKLSTFGVVVAPL